MAISTRAGLMGLAIQQIVTGLPNLVVESARHEDNWNGVPTCANSFCDLYPRPMGHQNVEDDEDIRVTHECLGGALSVLAEISRMSPLSQCLLKMLPD